MLFYIEYAEHESKYEGRKEEEGEKEEKEALLKHRRKEGKRKENKQDRIHKHEKTCALKCVLNRIYGTCF